MAARWATAGLTVAALLAVAACTGEHVSASAAPAPTTMSAGPTPSRSTGSAQAAALRGTAVTSAICPPASGSWRQIPAYGAKLVNVHDVVLFTFCHPWGGGNPMLVPRSSADFVPSLALLSRPDMRVLHSIDGMSAICGGAGLVRLLVYATGPAGTYLLHVPTVTGPCGTIYQTPLPPLLEHVA